MHTHILKEADALVLVVVQLLLLPPVLVFGRLETHGDQLRAGQHLAAVNPVFVLLIINIIADIVIVEAIVGCCSS